MNSNRKLGFTLIELLVVLAIVALLMTISLPRYFQSIDKGKETVLVENLRATRESIDRFLGDKGRYPRTLDELVEQRYLKQIPFDPITESVTTWNIIAPVDGRDGLVADIKSGAQGSKTDGTPFSDL